MTDQRPLYVIGPAGEPRDRLVDALEVDPDGVFDGVASFLAEEGPEPGVVCLVEGDPEGESLLDLLHAMAEGKGEWTPVLVRSTDEGIRAWPVSLGFSHGLDDVEAFVRGESPGALLELRRVVEEMARARHDVNNPLTSALAEVQLLLMDAPEGELGEALETIQEQLRRIRDLVASTKHIRQP